LINLPPLSRRQTRYYSKKFILFQAVIKKLDVSSSDLAEKIKESGIPADVCASDKEIVDCIKELSKSKSVILTIGIPPVYQILEQLLKG